MTLNYDEIRELALKYALANAVKYGGKADKNAVMSKIMAERKDLRKHAREVLKIVEEVIQQVNSMSIEEQISMVRSRWPELLEERKEETKKTIETLPPLPNDENYDMIVLRFAPNPDFVLTLGNARPAILNYAYKLKYERLGKKSKFILRFEDTDPKVKRPFIEDPQIRERYSEKDLINYKFIIDDLEWLGIRPDEIYVQSDRVVEGIYYDVARRLIEIGGAYVCTCPEDVWRRYRDSKQPCPCRSRNVEENLELFEKMLNGEFKEGEAVLRIKTDMSHPDPSVRDWVALRIVDAKHPRLVLKYGEDAAEKFKVWPTYNFAVAVDDHLMNVTHVLRAQEHRINTIKQSYIFRYLGWRQPETIHFGRLHIEGATLSKSKLRELGLRYDDPRLPTLAGLRERGILPEAIWEIMLNVGIKSSDARISLANLYSINRKYLDERANRYLAVIDPVMIEVEGIDKELIICEIPYHPSHLERGKRRIEIKTENGKVRLYISKNDVELLRKKRKIRLLELMNIEYMNEHDGKIITRLVSYDLDTARRERLDIVQWVPAEDNVRIIVERVDKTPLTEKEFIKEIGLAEPELARLGKGEFAQLFRYGFVKVIEHRDGELLLRFVHE
ncbi:MAG: glutamate--tRNA ligase [Crenarchaeota archaeon]|nr:glutamate--tRNA ligase [Thermoproteota archaeon]